MKLTCLLLVLLLSTNVKAQDRRMYYTDVDFWELQADTLEGKLDSIFIIGIGTSKERLFLNDLADKLIKDFAAKNITATYSHLGKNLEEANNNYSDLNQGDFKAAIVFSPTDTSQFYNKNIKSRFYVPLLITTGFAISRNRDTYVQAFDIALYRIQGSMTRLWSARVDIDCEPAKKKGAIKLGKQIMSRFVANNYVGGQE